MKGGGRKGRKKSVVREGLRSEERRAYKHIEMKEYSTSHHETQVNIITDKKSSKNYRSINKKIRRINEKIRKEEKKV